MAVERANPLPKGVYWQDFFRPGVGEKSATIDDFTAWLEQHRGKVKLRKSVYHGPDTDPLKAFVEGAWTLAPGLAAIANVLPDTGMERVWALFEVLEPVPWPRIPRSFGFPTIAEKGLFTEEQDTIQEPDPEPAPVDQVEKLIGQFFWGLGAMLGGYAVFKLITRRRDE
jgi:hypothetical protein